MIFTVGTLSPNPDKTRPLWEGSYQFLGINPSKNDTLDSILLYSFEAILSRGFDYILANLRQNIDIPIDLARFKGLVC